MSTFVGRERELAWITSRLENTSASGTQMVLLSGTAGVGKSRLLDELREQCRTAGFIVLEGYCVRHAAYAPFVSIASQALALLRARDAQESLGPGDLEALAPLVGGRTPKHHDPHDGERALVFIESVARLLAAIGKPRPVLVLLRGWSRADEASRTLVRALLDTAGPPGEATPGAPAALFVAGARSNVETEPGPHPRLEELPLGGLDRVGFQKLLADEELVARLHTATRGNPEELLAVLDHPPPSRKDNVQSRIDELGELPRRVVAALALAERPLPVHGLTVALHADGQSVARTIPGLVAAGLVRRNLDPGVGEVVIALSRHEDGEAVLERFTVSEISPLRVSLGDALESWGRAAPEEVLRHRIEGAPSATRSEEAVEVVRSLLRRHAPAAALALAQMAARHGRPSTLRTLAELAAQAAGLMGAHADAREVVALAEASNPADPELARLDATLAMSAGEWSEALSAIERADAHTHETDLSQRAANAVARAELAYQRGLLNETERAAREAIALGGDDGPATTQARNTLTKVFLVRRDLEQGWNWSLQSLDHARARHATDEILRGLINLGVVAILRNDLDEASRQLDTAHVAAQRGGSMMLQGVLRENLAVVAHLQGRFGDALKAYQEALGILTRVGNRRFIARVANNLGELYVHLGEVSRARRLCDYAAQVARNLSGALAAEGLMLRARVELADGQTDAARAAAIEAKTMFDAAGDTAQASTARLVVAKAWLLDGAVEQADKELRATCDVTERVSAERWQLSAELARARGDDGLDAAKRAVELAEPTGDAELLLSARVTLALAHIDHGDQSAARRQTELAQEVHRALLARVPETLRVTYETALGRVGIARLGDKIERMARTVTLPTVVGHPRDEDGMGLIGDGPAMRELRRRIARVAPQDVTVLLRGESGTGKERVAEALHQNSRRKSEVLVKVNCAALAEGVLLSELFGHEKGAFTGADRRRRGRFELADRGTIFLDEIGDVTPATQAALLRVLQERTFERVGGNETLKVDVRIIAATNRDLVKMVRDGSFREDLYYRLTSLTISLPALRERFEDLPLLAAWVLERETVSIGSPAKRLSTSALRRMLDHTWPGNIRELENVLRASALFADGDEITESDLQGLPESQSEPRGVNEWSTVNASVGAAVAQSEVDVVYDRVRHGGVSLFDMRREIERGCIAHAMEESGGNITRAAALLGMKRPRLSQLVREYGLAKGADPADNDRQ